MVNDQNRIGGQKINLLILHCGIRTGHFGMGSHIGYLTDYFLSQPSYHVMLLKLDSKRVATMQFGCEAGMEVIEIPQPENQLFLIEDETVVQNVYAKRICEMVYPVLKSKDRLIILCNSVIHYGVAKGLKQLLDARLVYVHHNFTWKACLKTSYAYFAEQWASQNSSLHPRAFVGTAYQAEIAGISDLAITVTYQAERFFVDVLGIEADRIRTIYNGIPLATRAKKEHKSELRSRYGFGESDKIILFCGRIAEEKGLSYLISAFKLLLARIPEARLVVIGIGQIQESLELVQPFWSAVTFTGKLNYAQIEDFYAMADVGAMPSTQEQCSISSIEMRFHRLPMIVSAVEGLDEMFDDGFDALKIPVHYDDSQIITFAADEICDRLVSVLEDQPLADALAENAYAKAVQTFTSERMTAEYDAVFQGFFSDKNSFSEDNYAGAYSNQNT